MGSAGFGALGPIHHASLLRAVTPDDGAMPDGRVEHVDLSLWQAVGRAIADLEWSASWTGWSEEDGDLEGDGWPDPDLIQSARAQRIDVQISPKVKVRVWPSWGWQELWFDFDISEITDQHAATALGHFVYLLGHVTQRQVLLSYEGAGHHVFARYDPATDQTTWS
jgi:hypothetical protein